jgi:hypothetical protein
MNPKKTSIYRRGGSCGPPLIIHRDGYVEDIKCKLDHVSDKRRPNDWWPAKLTCNFIDSDEEQQVTDLFRIVGNRLHTREMLPQTTGGKP